MSLLSGLSALSHRDVGRLLTPSGLEVVSELVLFRGVAIFESYLDAAVSYKLLKVGGPHPPPFDVIVLQHLEAGSSGWDSRKVTVKLHFDLSVGQFSGWSKVDAAIAVRNAIAHNLGRLTLRQLGKKPHQKILDSGFPITGGKIEIDEGLAKATIVTLAECVRYCDAFVAPTLHPPTRWGVPSRPGPQP